MAETELDCPCVYADEGECEEGGCTKLADGRYALDCQHCGGTGILPTPQPGERWEYNGWPVQIGKCTNGVFWEAVGMESGGVMPHEDWRGEFLAGRWRKVAETKPEPATPVMLSPSPRFCPKCGSETGGKPCVACCGGWHTPDACGRCEDCLAYAEGHEIAKSLSYPPKGIAGVASGSASPRGRAGAVRAAGGSNV